ncbi:flagellar hook-length control protein FliK [Myxococcus sp. RHSTA-1-4]|uniref:flagellar hook-length control protein FliK n=1 Tax=Myxococcus sp. RHSTA-1-4 TaxID=2874601 RepID=UPI001CC1C226|nr:flagellar hook-length control protein FliK [Myxococcus sp. RHSTA-1-4]MBZ4418438.1 flagellar hook-length control protein FliK [Myxococcus sp. RHSTA-1-4]
MSESETPSAPPKRRRLGHVARGGELNTLNIRFPGRYYAFVTEREGTDDDTLYLRLECVERDWMDKVWSELEKMFAPGDFLNFFNSVINGRKFEDFYDAATLDQLNIFYVVYYWFLRRVIDGGRDFAPVSVFEFELAPGDPLRDGVDETDWFHLELQAAPDSTRPDDDFVRAGRVRRSGAHLVRGFTPDTDAPPVERWMRRFVRVEDSSGGALTQGALKALHFPLPAPPLPPPSTPGGPGGGGRRVPEPPLDGPLSVPSLQPIPIPVVARAATPALARWMRSAASELSRHVRAITNTVTDFFDDWMPPGGPALALAGGPSLPGWRETPGKRGAASRPRPPPPTAHCYIGDGNPNPMDASDPNASFAPFVGLFNVGQGSCCVLYDNQGRAIVYYDFGSPANGQQATFPVIPQGHCVGPCMCNGPLIILSHWDMDHCDLGRFYPESFRCRWLAPQQHMGTAVCRDTVARVVHDGGEFYIWTASGRPGTAATPRGTPSSWDRPGGSHMRFPWGFIERNYRDTAQNPLAAGSDPRNNSGLALYVCVRDAPGVAAVGAGPVATDANNLGGAGRGLVTIGGGAPPGWVGAAFGGPALPGVPGGLAAFLAAMQPGGGAPNPAALAARQQSLAATAAVGPAAPGAGLPARQRLVIAALAVAQPALAPAVAVGLSRAAEVAAAAAAGAGGTLAQVAAAAGAAVIVEGGAPGTGLPTFNAIGVAAAGGAPLAPGGADALALAAVQGAIAGAPAVSPVVTAANTAAAAPVLGGAEAVKAAVMAVARTQAPPLVAARPGLSLEGEVARAAGVDNPVAVCNAVAPPLPQTLQGEAPFHANERFVLLTGDVNYGFIPAQKRPFAPPAAVAPGAAVALPYAPTAHPPVVVGLTATHHGSNKVGQNLLEPARIPWAPNTPATLSAAVAHQAAALPGSNLRRTATAAAAAAALGPVPPANLAQLAAAAEQAAHTASLVGPGTALEVARAAAAAVVLEAGAPGTLPGQFTLLGNVSAGAVAPGALAGATAAAWGAVIAALGGGGAAAVAGLAPVTAVPGGPEVVRAATEAVLMDAAPPAAHVTAARRAVKGAHENVKPGAPQPVLLAVAAAVTVRQSLHAGGAVAQAGATAIAEASEVGITAGALGAAAAIAGAGIAHLPGAAAGFITTAVAAIPNPPLAAVQAALGAAPSIPIDPANTAVAVANAFVGVAPEVVLDAMLSRGNPTTGATQFPLSVVEIAAALAALGPAAPFDTVAQVVEAARAAQNGQTAGAPVASGLAHAAADRIGYSYGVSSQTGGALAVPPFPHRYPSQGVGHPAHLAIDKYRRRGWAARRNTSMYADQSTQPDDSPRGHLALGWEVAPAYEGPLRPAAAVAGTISRACDGCAEVASARATAALGMAPATAVATAMGVVPAAAAAAPPAPAAVNAAGLGRLSVPAARAAQRSLVPTTAARAAVAHATAAVAGVAAANATPACMRATRAVLTAWWPAGMARADVAGGGLPSMAAQGLVALNPMVGATAAEAVTAAQLAVTGAGLALPPADLSAMLAATAVSLGEAVPQAIAAVVALLPGTAASATLGANAANQCAGGPRFTAAILGSAHAVALGAGLPAAVAASVAAGSAMAEGAPNPADLDAAANLVAGAAPVAPGYHALMGGLVNVPPPAIPSAVAAVLAASAAVANAGVVPAAPVEAGICYAAAAATVPGVAPAAAEDCASLLVGAALPPVAVNAANAATVANSSAEAGAAVAAAAAIMTAAGTAPAAPVDAAVCYAAAAAAVTAAAVNAGLAADAAVGAITAAAVPAVGATAVAAANAMNSTPEASAAVAAAHALVTADGLALPAAAQSAECYAAAAAVAGIPAADANAAAGSIALGVVNAATDAATAQGAGAAADASATVAAAMAVTQLALGGPANHRAVAAAAGASVIGITAAQVDLAANALSAGMGNPISIAISESTSLQASGATPEAAAALATVRALEPRSAPLAAAAAASAGVAPGDAAAATAIRIFNT